MQLSVSSDLDLIEHEWRCFEQRAECTPFQTFEWLSAWHHCIGNSAGVKPAIVIGRQCNGELLFILPLAIERALFYRRCVFLGHAVCDYNGPLLATEFPRVVPPADFAKWARTVVAFIQKCPEYKSDVVSFDKMPEKIGQQANPLLALATALNPDRAYRTNLGVDWDSFYSTKRSSARRKRDRNRYRRLADKGELRVSTLNDSEERQRTLKILFNQKSRIFARSGVSNLFDKPGYSDFYLYIAARAGPLVHISRLDVGSTCAAVNLGLRFRRCYFDILKSYDEGLERLGPGVFYLQELMRYAISQRFNYFDMTIGDHPYKLEWADEELRLYDHVAIAGCLGLLGAAQIKLVSRAKRLLKKSPLLWRLARRFKSVVLFLISSIRRKMSA